MHVTSEEEQGSWEQLFFSCREALSFYSGHCSFWRGKTPFVSLAFWVELPGAEPIPLSPELKVVGD